MVSSGSSTRRRTRSTGGRGGPLLCRVLGSLAVHIFIGWRRCPVKSVNRVTRCYKCHCFGHVAKHCRDPQETCGHCAAVGHRTAACPARKAGVAPICAAWRRVGRVGRHDIVNRECPSDRAALERLLSRQKTLKNRQTK